MLSSESAVQIFLCVSSNMQIQNLLFLMHSAHQSGYQSCSAHCTVGSNLYWNSLPIQRWSAGPRGQRTCSSPSTPYVRYLSGECICVSMCARGGSTPQCSVGLRQHKVTSNDSSLYDLFIYYSSSLWRVAERKREGEFVLEQTRVHLSLVSICFHPVLRHHHRLQQHPPWWGAKWARGEWGVPVTPTMGPPQVSLLQLPLCSKSVGTSLICCNYLSRAGRYTETHKTQEERCLLAVSPWVRLIF